MFTVGMRAVTAVPALPRRTVLGGAALAGLALPSLAACDGGPNLGGGGGAAEPDLRAEVDRAEPGTAEGAGSVAVPFSARLLSALDPEAVNLVCSPLSAQVALTMAGLGAAGDTRAEMEEALGGPMPELAESANTLSQVLDAVGDAEREEEDEDALEPPRASLVNGAWIQEGFEVHEPYLEDLGTWFGAGLFEADFAEEKAREKARQEINGWVAENTADLIEELVPEGTLSEASRLVLVNALHVKAAWPKPLTREGGRFSTADEQELSVEMLSGDVTGWFEDDVCRATALPTYGDAISLALIQPVDTIGAVKQAWADAAEDPTAGLGALLAGVTESEDPVLVSVPALDVGWTDSLTDPLKQLGMEQAFTDAADFSGISDTSLLISDVIQEAVLTVDENGLEAAAATAAIAGATSAPAEPRTLVLDSPFLLVVFERSTLAPLVLGWIGDPSETR